MNTWSELWWSFSIKIWWTFKIKNLLPFVFLLNTSDVLLYLYIVTFKNIISISICCLVFCIVTFSNVLFWKNTTLIIINIFLSVIRFYIFVIKSCTMMYKMNNIYLFRIKDKTALGLVQIEPSCKILSKAPTTHLLCECFRACALLPISFILIPLKILFRNNKHLFPIWLSLTEDHYCLCVND